MWSTDLPEHWIFASTLDTGFPTGGFSWLTANDCFPFDNGLIKFSIPLRLCSFIFNGLIPSTNCASKHTHLI